MNERLDRRGPLEWEGQGPGRKRPGVPSPLSLSVPICEVGIMTLPPQAAVSKGEDVSRTRDPGPGVSHPDLL